MFTSELLEQSWSEMSQYERDHFGLKFGDDFGLIAQALRANERFMHIGGIALMLSALELSGLKSEMEKAADKDSCAKRIIEQPNNLHNIMAEVFYLGYRIGKKEGETLNLEKLANSKE